MKKLVPRDSVLVPDEAELVYEGIIYDVFHWQQKLFDGTSTTFEMLRRADTTAAICIVDGKILVLDDEQPNRSSRKSFPGGRIEPHESSIVESAKREVLEESGYTFKNWRLIHVEQPFSKIEWFVHILVAWDGEQVAAPQNDAGERITVTAMEFDEVKALALNGVPFIDESAKIFKDAESVEDLLALPEFVGLEIER